MSCKDCVVTTLPIDIFPPPIKSKKCYDFYICTIHLLSDRGNELIIWCYDFFSIFMFV